MRQIKFRAFDGKKMIEPYSVRDGKAFIIKQCNRDDKVLRGDDGVNYYSNWDIDVATDYPLMQFTGLTDINGVEIYEGDIVKLNDCFVAEVKFYGCGFAVITKSIYANRDFDLHAVESFEEVEVIGNSYQNPELLK